MFKRFQFFMLKRVAKTKAYLVFVNYILKWYIKQKVDRNTVIYDSFLCENVNKLILPNKTMELSLN